MNYVTAYLSGGSYYHEGEDIYISYEGLPAGASIGATVSGMENATVTISSSPSGSGQIIVHTEDDNQIGGGNDLTIQLSLSGSNVQFAPNSSSSFNVSVLECVEFISYEDQPYLQMVAYNDDSYRTYVKGNALAGAELQVRGEQILANGGSGIRYRLVNPSPFFEINDTTGAITLKMNAEDIVSQSGRYSHSLLIRAYESRVVTGESGGDYWTDEASVDISIATWNVSRNGDFKAWAFPTDGCSIELLAEEVGLTLAQYQNWLTVNNLDYQVELFAGGYKAASQVTYDDVLARTTSYIFEVPNTILAAWGYDPLQQTSMHWQDNVSQLSGLGFRVVTYQNYLCNYSSAAAKTQFFQAISDLSLNKRLHGLYTTSHGCSSSITFGNPDNSSWGPYWSIGLVTNQTYNPNADTWCINQAVNYDLGALIVHSCQSGNSGIECIVSSNGISQLFSGTTFSYDGHAFSTLWGCKLNANGTYTIGGAQKTSILLNVSLAPDWRPLF